MSTYPVDIKSTTASGVAVHDAGGAAAPGRALGLYVSKEGGQAATTVKIKDNTTVLAEFLIPATIILTSIYNIVKYKNTNSSFF